MVSLERLHPQVCWERSVETLTARKDDIAGLAVASDERIEAYLLYTERGADGDCVAPLVHRGRWSPSEATALSTPRARHERPSGSRRSTRRRSRRSSWRRSVSAPPAGIDSTRRGRGPNREYGMTGSRLRRNRLRRRSCRERQRSTVALPASAGGTCQGSRVLLQPICRASHNAATAIHHVSGHALAG